MAAGGYVVVNRPYGDWSRGSKKKKIGARGTGAGELLHSTQGQQVVVVAGAGRPFTLDTLLTPLTPFHLTPYGEWSVVFWGSGRSPFGRSRLGLVNVKDNVGLD